MWITFLKIYTRRRFFLLPPIPFHLYDNTLTSTNQLLEQTFGPKCRWIGSSGVDTKCNNFFVLLSFYQDGRDIRNNRVGIWHCACRILVVRSLIHAAPGRLRWWLQFILTDGWIICLGTAPDGCLLPTRSGAPFFRTSDVISRRFSSPLTIRNLLILKCVLLSFSRKCCRWQFVLYGLQIPCIHFWPLFQCKY